MERKFKAPDVKIIKMDKSKEMKALVPVSPKHPTAQIP